MGEDAVQTGKLQAAESRLWRTQNCGHEQGEREVGPRVQGRPGVTRMTTDLWRCVGVTMRLCQVSGRVPPVIAFARSYLGIG